MADLFQSEYDMGSLRRGVQDGETLWTLLGEDGSITVVPDPGESEVEAAAKELAKAHEEQQKREAKGEKLDPEEEKEERDKIAALSRLASFQPPVAAQLPAEEDEDEGRARKSQQPAEREKAEAR